MVELARADLAALLDVAASAQAVTDTDAFGDAVVGPLRRLVPADSVTYNEIDTRRRRFVVAVDPPDALDGLDGAAFTRFLSQHPVIAYSRRSGDGRAHTISDFVDRRRYHRTDLYATFFRPARVEHQISITLAYAPSHIVGIAFNRGCRDFSLRDRAVLNLARIQLVTGYQSARGAHERVALIKSLESALDDLHRGVIVVDPSGHLLATTPTAKRLLGTHLGVRATDGDRLPPRLALLGRGAISRAQPIRLAGQGVILNARVLDGGDDETRTIVIDERPAGTHPPLAAAALTERETEILRLVAAGHDNAAVAVTLGVSIRTVHKHLEHLYAKLQVHDRTAAASRWFAEHGPIPG